MAVNPLPFLQNMPDPGQAFLQAFNQARAQRDQKIAQQSRQAQYAQWVQRLQQDRSPETMSQFMLQFPEMSDTIKKAFEPLDEANRQSRLGYTTQVYSALERGDTETAKSVAQDLLDAAKNTPGQEQFAKELEFGLELMDTNPEQLKVGLANAIFTLDPERYKTLYNTKNGELTGFQKDLIAAGVDPTSEEGRAKAKEFVSLKVDPIVQMPTPSGGQFIGRQSEYYRMFGQGAPAPQPKGIPPVGTVKNGYRFNGGDPAKPGNWSKVEGGASSNASGGFRG